MSFVSLAHSLHFKHVSEEKMKEMISKIINIEIKLTNFQLALLASIVGIILVFSRSEMRSMDDKIFLSSLIISFWVTLGNLYSLLRFTRYVEMKIKQRKA